MNQEREKRRWTRRRWLREAGLAAGAAGAGASAGYLAATQLAQYLPSPDIEIPVRGEIREALHYTKFPTAQWWDDRVGEVVRVTDFELWQGATAVWRGLFIDGELQPGTGYPVLVIRVPRDDAVFRSPGRDEVPLPAGFDFFYDDPGRDLRIVVVYDRCAHLCCFPGWHVVTDPPPSRDYANFVSNPEADVPTYYVYAQDPIYCLCHGSQFDPMVLVRNVNPRNGAEYVGPLLVHGPATRAIPVIPVRAQFDVLIGGMPNPLWFQYCGD